LADDDRKSRDSAARKRRENMPSDNVREIYNYDSFSRSSSEGKSNEFKNSLRAGDEALDFDLPNLEGDRVRLSDFRGKKHVLIEFGSIT
jgi:hypothetical protein